MRKTKAIISFLLTAAILVTMFTFVPFSAGAVVNYNVSTEQELSDACAEINSNGGEATISLTADISGVGACIGISKSGAKVTVIGNGHTLTAPLSAVDVSNGAKVYFGDGSSTLTLKSVDTEGDNPGIIFVREGSQCHMYDKVTLKDHKGNNYFGGGVTVEGGLFHMHGGLIDNCGIDGGSVCYGGGVAVFAGGEFIMDGGTISNCYAASDYNDNNELRYTAMGGGVFVTGGSTFIMNSGTIRGCTATNMGGGIAVDISYGERVAYNTGNIKSRAVINGGTITGNSADYGAGIFASGLHYAYASAIATVNPGIGTPDNPGLYMNGGTVSENTAAKDGGGVFICGIRQEDNITLSNATVSGNAAVSGAGIMINEGLKKTVINGCTVSGNASSSYGGGIALTKNSFGDTLIKDTTITNNTTTNNNNKRGAGVYYDKESKLEISGENTIQNNKYNNKLNNLNILSLKKPVYVTGDLTGSQIGVSDPTLWDDNKEDTDADAVSTLHLTSGFKTNNASLIPADVFTSDHESWYVDYGEKFDSPTTIYKYTAKRYDNTLGLTDGYEILKRDNGDLYIKIPASTFTGYTENVSYLYNELCYLYDNNNRYTFEKDYILYGQYSSYPGKVYYDSVTCQYVSVFKMGSSSVVVLTSTDPDSFENYAYDNVLFQASGNVQKFLNGEENILALKIYYYYDETDISGLFGDYTEEELEYDEPLDFEGADTKTIYKINEYGIATTKYVISKNSEEETGSYDYTGEVRLVRRTSPIKFHDNKDKVNKGEDGLFRVYNAEQNSFETEDGIHSLTNYKVTEFYNIPSFAKDKYVFAGWYTTSDNSDNDSEKAFKFDSNIPANVTDVYAHWIPVGEVNKDDSDDKELPSSMNNKYGGFELFGVQIRPEANFDPNQGDYTPGGLRFVTSISEDLLTSIDALSDKTTNGNKVEYGFVTAAENTVKAVADDSRMGIDKNTYKLQYKGENVNGVDTLLNNKTADERKTPNNFRYITNVDCTSKEKGYGNNTKIKEDHRNFTDYRLATYVVTYDDDESGANKGKNVAARAYMRYYDANGLLRTFYNDYAGTNFYGGCSTSYTTASEYATNTKTTR